MEYVVDAENKIWRREELSITDLQNLIATANSEITIADQRIAEAQQYKTDKQDEKAHFETLLADAMT